MIARLTILLLVVDVELTRDLSSIQAEWDGLAEERSAPPWLWGSWFRIWEESFSAAPISLLFCRRGGRLVGVLPLLAGDHTVRSPTNDESPGFTLLAADEDAARTLSAALFASGRRHYVLFPLTGGRGATALEGAARRAGYLLSSRVVARSPSLSTEADWEGFLRSRGTTPFREERRKKRMLERSGVLGFQVFEGGPGLERMFNQALAIEAAGWKGEAGTSIAGRPDALRFYRELTHWGAERGWLRLKFLRLDGQAIAFDLAFECHGVCYLFKTSYDPALRKLSPGLVLRYRAIQWACDGGTRRYEFLGKDEPFKRKWADAYQDRSLVHAFAARASGRLEYTAYRYLRPMKRWLRREPSGSG